LVLLNERKLGHFHTPSERFQVTLAEAKCLFPKVSAVL
jgi:hypothetical protein